MNFSELKDDTDFLVNTDSSQYPVADKTRNINRHFADVVSLILRSDAQWKWDDSNQTDHPILLIDLIDGTQDYEISDASYLKLQTVEIKDINGKHKVLQPIDRTLGTTQNLTYLEEGDAGMPRYFSKLGGSLFLYPTPSASLTTLLDGMRIHYQRGASYFIITDTTKEPGFAEPFHRILSVGAALDYAISNNMTQKINILTPMLTALNQSLVIYYAARANDDQPSFRLHREDYGAGAGYNVNTRISDKRAF